MGNYDDVDWEQLYWRLYDDYWLIVRYLQADGAAYQHGDSVSRSLHG